MLLESYILSYITPYPTLSSHLFLISGIGDMISSIGSGDLFNSCLFWYFILNLQSDTKQSYLLANSEGPICVCFAIPDSQKAF